MPKFAIAPTMPSSRWQASSGSSSVVGCQIHNSLITTTAAATTTTDDDAMPVPVTTTRFSRPTTSVVPPMTVADTPSAVSNAAATRPSRTTTFSVVESQSVPSRSSSRGGRPKRNSRECHHQQPTSTTGVSFSVVAEPSSSSCTSVVDVTALMKDVPFRLHLFRLNENPAEQLYKTIQQEDDGKVDHNIMNRRRHDDDHHHDHNIPPTDITTTTTTTTTTTSLLYWPCLAFDSLDDAMSTIQLLYDWKRNQDVQNLLARLSLKIMSTMLVETANNNKNNNMGNDYKGDQVDDRKTSFAAVVALRNAGGCYPEPYLNIDKRNAINMAQKDFLSCMNCLKNTMLVRKDRPALKDALFEQFRLQQMMTTTIGRSDDNSMVPNTTMGKRVREGEVDHGEGLVRPNKFQRTNDNASIRIVESDNRTKTNGWGVDTTGLEQKSTSKSLMKRSTFTVWRGPANYSLEQSQASVTTETSSKQEEERQGKEEECSQNGTTSTTTNRPPRMTFTVASFGTTSKETTTGEKIFVQHRSARSSPPKKKSPPPKDSTMESQSDSVIVQARNPSVGLEAAGASMEHVEEEGTIGTIDMDVSTTTQSPQAMDVSTTTQPPPAMDVLTTAQSAPAMDVSTTTQPPPATAVAKVNGKPISDVLAENSNELKERNEGASAPSSIKGKVASKTAAQRLSTTGTKSVVKVMFETTGKIIPVDSWSTVCGLLKELGHVFYSETGGSTKSYYCRPYGDPRKYDDARPGHDYFNSLEAYRNCLCANDVEYVGKELPWTEQQTLIENCSIIERWVRFSIFGKACHRKEAGRTTRITLSTEEMSVKEYHMSKPEALKALKAMGVKYKRSVLGDGYVLPGDERRTILSEEDLWAHLKKYGLPDACDYGNIDASDSMLDALELFIIRNVPLWRCQSTLDMFRQKNMQEGTLLSGRLPKHAVLTPAADKAALEDVTRGGRTRRKTTELDKIRKFPELETLQEPPNRSDDMHDNQTGFDMSSADSALEDPYAGKLMYAQPKPSETGEGPNYEEEDADDSETATEIPQVKLSGKTVREKLKCCLKAMRKEHKEKVVASGNFSKSMTSIKRFVKTAIKSKGRNAGPNNPPILYICGAPGTGKTMSTTQICNDAIDSAVKSKEEWEESPQVCYLNCSHLHGFSKREALEKVAEYMDMSARKLHRASSDDATNFAMILVLDEIDVLVRNTGTEGCLKTLLSWAADENNLLCLIGISNSINDPKSRRLYDLGMGGNKLVFHRYRKDELVKIAESKIGFSVVDQKALEFVAAKVAASSGDAREFLELVSLAVQKRLDSLSKDKLDECLTKPVIGIRDAMMTIRETNVKYKDVIESLTTCEKITLCAGVHLSRKFEGKAVRLEIVKGHTMEALGFDNDLSLEDFKGIIERLQDNGLLKLAEKDRRKNISTVPISNLLRFEVCFDLQLEDVESALEETLMKEDFYKRLVERVKGIRVND